VGPDASDERLNAFVDAQLSPAEAEKILTEMQDHVALRQRVSELQEIKTLIRHAYHGIEASARSRPRAVRGRRTRAALVAMLLLAAGVAAGWLGRGLLGVHCAAGFGLLPEAPSVATTQATETRDC
jgi:anti-sigma factor RsiW